MISYSTFAEKAGKFINEIILNKGGHQNLYMIFGISYSGWQSYDNIMRLIEMIESLDVRGCKLQGGMFTVEIKGDICEISMNSQHHLVFDEIADSFPDLWMRGEKKRNNHLCYRPVFRLVF